MPRRSPPTAAKVITLASVWLVPWIMDLTASVMSAPAPGDAMACNDQVSRHMASHAPKPDEPDLHVRPPFRQ
jgi:hypothetical protein